MYLLGWTHIQLGVPPQLHLALEPCGERALPHGLGREMLVLVEQDLGVHHHEALYLLYLRGGTACWRCETHWKALLLSAVRAKAPGLTPCEGSAGHVDRSDVLIMTPA